MIVTNNFTIISYQQLYDQIYNSNYDSAIDKYVTAVSCDAVIGVHTCMPSKHILIYVILLIVSTQS